jgi:TPR repeat protein
MIDSEAPRCFKRAADQNDQIAQFTSGRCLPGGEGVEINLTEAARYFKLAADQNYDKAQWNYGVCLYRGEGVKINFTEAAQYCKLAADQGVVDSQIAYGFALEFGIGVHPNISEAVRYYEKAATLGDPIGANSFGLCLEFGKGIRQDLSRAAEYYKMAADADHVGGRNNFAFCLEHGLGVDIDLNRAATYYRPDTYCFHKRLLFGYARCLHYGIGVEPDLEEAATFYILAHVISGHSSMRNTFRCLRALNRARFSRDQFPELELPVFKIFDICSSIRPFEPRKRISDYIVGSRDNPSSPLLGTGGSSKVVLATDVKTRERIAVKYFRPSPDIDTQAFLRETEALCKLNHPCVLRIISCSFPSKTAFAEIHTELAEHGSLEKVFKRVQAGFAPVFWTPTNIGIIISGIVLGMRYVHGQGYIHQDLKPKNIMINGDGHALIGDFGTSRLESDDATPTPEAGTVYYAAPEMYKDDLPHTSKADVFSFGLVLYEILFGSAVFWHAEAPAPIMRMILRGDMPPIPDRGGNYMQDLIRRCWSMKPDDRPSFDDILNEFRGINFAIIPEADPATLQSYVSSIQLWETVKPHIY